MAGAGGADRACRFWVACDWRVCGEKPSPRALLPPPPSLQNMSVIAHVDHGALVVVVGKQSGRDKQHTAQAAPLAPIARG